MVAAAVLCGSWTGQEAAVAAAAVEGAQGAIELCISLAGMMCLWTGVMEIMRRSGLAEKLSRLLRPVLGLIFPQTARDREIMDSIAANVSANLLGLGNAATPLGIEAASQLISHIDHPELMATKSIIPHRIVERESCGTRS